MTLADDLDMTATTMSSGNGFSRFLHEGSSLIACLGPNAQGVKAAVSFREEPAKCLLPQWVDKDVPEVLRTRTVGFRSKAAATTAGYPQ